MKTRWQRLLQALWAPPTDPFTALRLRMARQVEVGSLFCLVGLFCLLPFRDDVTWVDWGLYPAIGLMLGCMLLLRARFPRVAGVLGGFGFISLVTGAAWFRQGLSSGVTSGAMALAVVVGGLLWGPGKTFIVALAGSTGVALLAWGAPTPAVAPLRSWGEITAILVTLALFVELSLAALGARIIEVQAGRRRFQELFDGSPDGLVLVDKNGRIELLNATARSLFESTRDGCLGVRLSDLPAFQGDNAALLRPLLANGGGRKEDGIPVRALPPSQPASLVTGRFHDVAFTTVTAEHEPTSNYYWLVTIRDTTDRVSVALAGARFEAQLAESKSLEALGRLAGGVAHDFNNLLMVILGSAELIVARPELDSGLRQDVESIFDAAERAAELTSQLLAFGRRQVLTPAIYCPNESVVRLRPLLDRLVPSNITVVIDLADTLGCVRVDPARLEQVLVNLVTNAADAMPTGGNLLVTSCNLDWTPDSGNDTRWVFAGEGALPAGSYVQISVKDTGQGMDEATQAQVFEPFYTTKALGKGTGLGLATVLGVVRQSGGFVRLRSQPGRGSEFQLLFPRLSQPSGKPLPPVESRPMMEDLPRLRVLLVEDSESVRCSVASMLRAAHHEVHAASDGKAALLAFAGRIQEFDLLLTDVVMPHMNGQQLAEALQQVAPRLRVLFMTGYTREAIVQPGGVLGEGLNYLPKPFTRRQLERKLSEIFAC